jgi:hypothetical protein
MGLRWQGFFPACPVLPRLFPRFQFAWHPIGNLSGEFVPWGDSFDKYHGMDAPFLCQDQARYRILGNYHRSQWLVKILSKT